MPPPPLPRRTGAFIPPPFMPSTNPQLPHNADEAGVLFANIALRVDRLEQVNKLYKVVIGLILAAAASSWYLVATKVYNQGRSDERNDMRMLNLEQHDADVRETLRDIRATMVHRADLPFSNTPSKVTP